MTNAEKFKEVFGFTPRTENCPDLSPNKVCQQQTTCEDCAFNHWWEKEYKIRYDDLDDGK